MLDSRAATNITRTTRANLLAFMIIPPEVNMDFGILALGFRTA